MRSRAVHLRDAAVLGVGELSYPFLLLLLAPVYIRILGFEAYGLVGFLSSAVLLVGVVTQAFGMALQRELGRRTATGVGGTISGLVRTLERAYWVISAGVMTLWTIALLAVLPTLQTTQLTLRVLVTCGVLLGTRVALGVPRSAYHALLMAADRQKTLGAINGAVGLLSGLGGLLAVLATRSIVALYVVDAAVTIGSLVVMRQAAYRTPDMTGAARTPFDAREFRRLCSSAADLIWIHGAGVLLKQADRLILGIQLPLGHLGLYTVATAPGRVLPQVSSPFLATVFPETCRLAVSPGRPELAAHIWGNARIVAAISIACVVPLAWCAEAILSLLTGLPDPPREGVAALRSYVYAAACSATATAFAQAAVALGRTRFNVRFLVAGILWFPPFLWALTARYGLAGAAHAWLAFCSVSLIVHASYASAALRTWGALMLFAMWMMVAGGIAVGVMGGMSWVWPGGFSSPGRTVVLAGACGAAVFALLMGFAAATSHGGRRRLRAIFG